MPIKTIIFDFGNVLLTLNEKVTIDGFREILDQAKCIDIYEMVFEPFERGEISEEAFFNRLQRRSKKILKGDVYISLWNAMLGVFPQVRIEKLREYRKSYKLILLSNTNITHLRSVRYKIEKENGLADFEKILFDASYFSHEIKMRKPEKRIFEFVIRENNLLPEECLFIDDKIENIQGAGLVGIHTHHHNPEEEIFDILPGLLKSINN
jgi:glucose-1-phosphatase